MAVSDKTSTDDNVDFGFADIPRDQKAGRVRAVFDSVASRYDVMNDAMSAGVHRLWKDALVTRMRPQPGELLIDVAGGTGDIARRFLARAEAVRARRGGDPARAVVTDINTEMLLAGLGSRRDRSRELVRATSDAEALPFPDACADAVSISFGIRNVTDRSAALSEFHRVLKPGGRLFVLEFSTPPEPLIRSVYDAYSLNVIPALGQAITGDRDSYQYLVESIRRFPRPRAFASMMETAGFSNVAWDSYSVGVAVAHRGWKV